jgi:WD40 repeat protein
MSEPPHQPSEIQANTDATAAAPGQGDMAATLDAVAPWPPLPPGPGDTGTMPEALRPSSLPPLLPGRLCLSGYELLAELGRGGMGVVYQARHLALRRTVALKMILAGGHAGAAERERFRTEAEAIARLQHPHIVQVYEIGEHEGLPFFSLEFCAGGSLEKKLAGTPLPPGDAAALVEKLARAMQAAHAKGVLHRDLKPANVLLAEDGAPKVTDFGLAKMFAGERGASAAERSAGQASGLTQTGSVLGTPSYMAPEQAGGKSKQLGPPCDIYALGAILYECLTGRPPFRAATPLDTLLQVLDTDPVPPGRLNARVPRDLETICLKCLAKEPARRYASAAALADDLGRFQRHEPIVARPASLMERGAKWVKRRPAVAGLLTLLVALTAVGVGLVVWQWREAVAARADAEAETLRATRQERETDKQLRRAVQAEKDARDSATAARAAERKALVGLYASWINQANRDIDDGNLAQALQALDRCPLDVRGWEYDFLRRRSDASSRTLRGHTGLVLAVASSADGKCLASASARIGKAAEDRPLPGEITIWNADTGAAVVTIPEQFAFALALSPDGTRLASSQLLLKPNGELSSSVVHCWDTASGQLLWSGEAGGRGLCWKVAFSPDGQRLFGLSNDEGKPSSLSGNKLTLWNLKGKPLDTVAAPPEGWLTAGFCDDGTCRVVGPAPDRAKGGKGNLAAVVRDVVTGKQFGAFRWDGYPHACALAPDGSELAMLRPQRDAGQMHVMLATLDGAEQLLGKYPMDEPVRDDEMVARPLSFSADSQTLVQARGKVAWVWRPKAGLAPPLRLSGHTGNVIEAAVSADGKRVATASVDGTVKLWDGDQFAELVTVTRELESVLGLAFSPNGKLLAAGVNTYEPNARATAAGVRLWSMPDHRPLQTLPLSRQRIEGIAFSPDSLRLATASARDIGDHPGEVVVWDVAASQRLLTLDTGGRDTFSVAFSPDGRWLATAGWGRGGRRQDRDIGEVKLWDAQSGAEVRAYVGHTGLVWKVAFSKDGRRLASSSYDGTVRVWEVDTGKELFVCRGHHKSAYDVTFSPDGTLLASVGGDPHDRVKPGDAFVWDAVTGEKLWEMPGHAGLVGRVAFSPDGTRLVTGSGIYDAAKKTYSHSELKLWDVATRQEVLIVRTSHGPRSFGLVLGLTFSPNGRWLAYASSEKITVLKGEPGR